MVFDCLMDFAPEKFFSGEKFIILCAHLALALIFRYTVHVVIRNGKAYFGNDVLMRETNQIQISVDCFFLSFQL